jgi:hypothetical protein
MSIVFSTRGRRQQLPLFPRPRLRRPSVAIVVPHQVRVGPIGMPAGTTSMERGRRNATSLRIPVLPLRPSQTPPNPEKREAQADEN